MSRNKSDALGNEKIVLAPELLAPLNAQAAVYIYICYCVCSVSVSVFMVARICLVISTSFRVTNGNIKTFRYGTENVLGIPI